MNNKLSDYPTDKGASKIGEGDALQRVQDSLVKLYEIKEPIQREYELIRASKQYDIPPESYRQMFKEYCLDRWKKEWRISWRTKPFWWLEKLMEWLNRAFSQMDMFQILEYLSKLSILVGVIVFLFEIPQRAEQKATEKKRSQYEAWQVIISREGKKESAGRIDALQDLNRDGVSLAGLNVEKAILHKINLKGADLWSANLSDANLGYANLSGATLFFANLNQAAMNHADLSGAKLNDAHLNGTYLWKADLSDAKLNHAYLNRAILLEANLNGADLTEADLTDADLKNANLCDADLKLANLKAVKNLNPDQIKCAKNWEQAKYDRDVSKQLGLLPESGSGTKDSKESN